MGTVEALAGCWRPEPDGDEKEAPGIPCFKEPCVEVVKILVFGTGILDMLTRVFPMTPSGAGSVFPLPGTPPIIAGG